MAPRNLDRSPSPTRKSVMEAALSELNNTVSTGGGTNAPLLSAVATQLGGDNHPYKFSRRDPEYTVLLGLSAAAVAGEAGKLGIRCYDKNNRQIVKEDLAARVFAVHKNTYRDPDWFEPSMFGSNPGEFWKPKIIAFFQGIIVVVTMFAVNYGRMYYAREFNCHWVSGRRLAHTHHIRAHHHPHTHHNRAHHHPPHRYSRRSTTSAASSIRRSAPDSSGSTPYGMGYSRASCMAAPPRSHTPSLRCSAGVWMLARSTTRAW